MKNLSFALISIFSLAIVSTPVFAWNPDAILSDTKTDDDGWDNMDTTLELAYMATHVVDWEQTRSGLCQSNAYQEPHTILGDCPSSRKVIGYFLGTALLHTGLSYVLQKKYRRIFQSTSVAAQLGIVTNNASIGINMKF